MQECYPSSEICISCKAKVGGREFDPGSRKRAKERSGTVTNACIWLKRLIPTNNNVMHVDCSSFGGGPFEHFFSMFADSLFPQSSAQCQFSRDDKQAKARTK